MLLLVQEKEAHIFCRDVSHHYVAEDAGARDAKAPSGLRGWSPAQGSSSGSAPRETETCSRGMPLSL